MRGMASLTSVSAALLLATCLLGYVIADDVIHSGPAPRDIAQLCVRSCECQLVHLAATSKAHLQVRCAQSQVERFASTLPGNTTLVVVNKSSRPVNITSLADDGVKDDELLALPDGFQCANCKQRKDIDLATFVGLGDLDLSNKLLVELTFDPSTDLDKLLVFNLVGDTEMDCDAFLNKFGKWRPKVSVECDVTTPEEKDVTTPEEEDVTTPDEDFYSKTTTTWNAMWRGLRNNSAPGTEESKDSILEDEALMDDEEGKEPRPVINDRALPIGTPSPEEDPATFFPPWKIAVIVVVGVLILVVAGYYVWNKWSEIRACCCGSYQQP